MAKFVEDINKLLVELASKVELYVPTTNKSIVNFEKFTGEPFEAEKFKNSTEPIKKILFPESEILYFYKKDENGYKFEQVPLDEKKKIIFGARPCDCAGVERLDRVFYGDYMDPYYDARRKNTIIIGLACNEPPYHSCFCTSVDLSPSSTVGMDVLATQLENGYLLEEISDKGKELLGSSELVRDANEDEVKKAKKLHEESHKKVKKIDIDTNAIEFESDLWGREGKRCIGCGTCTFLCPTCHCFTIEYVGSTRQGRVIRSWDTCQFQAYSLEASGFNPRPNKGERVRQRLHHKYRYFADNFGEFQCVGCGRCVNLCPVNIDVREVMVYFKKKKQKEEVIP